jgi:hypothetical protein
VNIRVPSEGVQTGSRDRIDSDDPPMPPNRSNRPARQCWCGFSPAVDSDLTRFLQRARASLRVGSAGGATGRVVLARERVPQLLVAEVGGFGEALRLRDALDEGGELVRVLRS